MKKDKQKLVDKLFLIILSVQTVLMGIAFGVQILRIYFVEKTYTREICIQYLNQILSVLIIWILMIIASFIYFYITNSYKEGRHKLTNTEKLRALLRRTPEFNNSNLEEQYSLVKKEEKKRLISKIINIVILLICSLMGILYLVNPKHFDGANPTPGIVNMSYYLIPWVVIALISSVVSMLFNEYSAKTEIDLIKAIIKSDGRVKPSSLVNKRVEMIKNIATISLLIVAVSLIIVGVFDGSAKNVLLKAVVICTECIGLG